MKRLAISILAVCMLVACTGCLEVVNAFGREMQNAGGTLERFTQKNADAKADMRTAHAVNRLTDAVLKGHKAETTFISMGTANANRR